MMAEQMNLAEEMKHTDKTRHWDAEEKASEVPPLRAVR